MDQALRIAQLPPDGWAVAIAEISDTCAHADCGAPRNCRERVSEYLRVQYKMRQRRDACQAAAR